MRLNPGRGKDRDALVDRIERSGVSPRVVDAFRALDRRDFVPPGHPRPYMDRPIEILEGQTTSQPSLIAQMVDAADLLPGDKVLEVGTGFGYQTAILARLTGNVVSIERHASIAAAARDNIERAGIEGAEVVLGDGWAGMPEHAPYEAIIVSAAAARVPDAFADQLADGGRLVIPVRTDRDDEVLVYVKRNDRLVKVGLLTPARFVPLVPGEPSQSDEPPQSNE